MEKKNFATKAIHLGSEPDVTTGAMVPNIALSTTYSQRQLGNLSGSEDPNSFGLGYEYQRTGNPTRGAFERVIAACENGKYAVAFSSGSAAGAAIVQTIETGSHVISIDDVYGGTQRQFRKIFNPNSNIKFDFIDLQDLNLLKNTLNSETRLIWIESPTNPTLKITDIKKISNFIKNELKRKDIKIVVDNTFATPYFQNPLDLGADVVLHSVTKYIGGHSDVVMGCVITNDQKFHADLRFIQNGLGAVPSPFDCYMAIRGLKTLHLRMERAQNNALQIANYLERSKEYVDKCIYPGLESHPNHLIAKIQMKGYGAMITFLVNGDLEKTKLFLQNLQIFTLAESLGAVESLAECPALMTHASVPKEDRIKLGILDNLVRLSVGVEDINDLINDLENSFKLMK